MPTLKLNLTDFEKEKIKNEIKKKQSIGRGTRVNKQPPSYVDPSLRK